MHQTMNLPIPMTSGGDSELSLVQRIRSNPSMMGINGLGVFNIRCQVAILVTGRVPFVREYVIYILPPFL